jgi:uracil-DNA glycosylase
MWTEEEIYNEFHESWHPVVEIYMRKIKKALNKSGTIYPPPECIFRVFQMPVEEIKVIILAQDPYHGNGQATGLAFDCANNKGPIQPSLRNIFKEINNEFPKRKYNLKSGCIERWFNESNIFLLNSALTVREGDPGSLMKFWYDFTDAIIQFIADYNSKCVFLLMGSPAKTKSRFIADKDRIVSCTHPSPMSAHRGFFGSGVFIEIENLVGEIDWSI